VGRERGHIGLQIAQLGLDMRRLLIPAALVAFGLSAAVPSAQANTVTLTDWTTGAFAGNAPNGGGPFRATTTGDLLGEVAFITFCIEFNEHFGYGGTYNFALSGAAVAGGVAGGNPDPVSDATKWLFAGVSTGQYTSFYTPATGDAVGSNTGAVFQEAIWLLENERTASQVGAAAVSLAAYATTHENWAALYASGARVFAMNLTTLSGDRSQDQLAYTHVPDSGATVWLLVIGMGVTGVAASRMQARAARR
jgi:hypothetical protein